MAEQVEVIRSALLGTVLHGFFGRRGGVSGGVVSGLNAGLGADDDGAAIAENRRIAIEAVFPGAALVTPYQVHSADAVIVDEPWPMENRPNADALVTNRRGLLLGIVTADCAPVLLADEDAGVIGAAHAGWRGAFDGVIASTVAAMERLGAQATRMKAAIGPCIGLESYEVDDAFKQRIGAAGAQFFRQGRPGHHQFDLEGYVAQRLAESGVKQVDRLGLDTYADPSRFYSYRRATHLNEQTYGRQISLIGLAG